MQIEPWIITIAVLAILALIFSLTTAIFAILAYANVIGLKNSTHQVQWMPLDPSEQGATGKELLKEMDEAFGYKDEREDYYGGNQ